MNADLYNDHHEPDCGAAHFAAFHKLRADDKATGVLNCAEYLIEFHRELSEPPPPVSRDLMAALEAMPSLGRDTVEAQLVAEAFTRSHLKIPVGLNDLPVSWGYAIRKVIMGTHWPEFPDCHIQDVFGWNHVSRFGAHLRIQFEHPLAGKPTPWCDIGQLIHALHYAMEPGPYTPQGRLCEFSV